MISIQRILMLWGVISLMQSCAPTTPDKPVPSWLTAQEGLWVLENTEDATEIISILGLIIPSQKDSSINMLIEYRRDNRGFGCATLNTKPIYTGGSWQLYMGNYSITYQEEKERLVLNPTGSNESQAVLYYKYFGIQEKHQLSIDSLIHSIGSSVWKCRQKEQYFYLFINEGYDYLSEEGVLRENLAIIPITIMPCIEDSCVTPRQHRRIYADRRNLQIEQIENYLTFYSINSFQEGYGERFICSELSENRMVLNKISRGRAEEDIIMERVISISPNVDSFLRYSEIAREWVNRQQ